MKWSAPSHDYSESTLSITCRKNQSIPLFSILLARWSQRGKQQRAQGAGKQGRKHEPELGEMVLQ